MKTKRYPIKFTKSRKLKDGTYRETLHIPKDMQKQLYKQAMSDNALKLSDLEYQAAGRKNVNMFKIVVAAQFVKLLGDFVEKHAKEATGKEPKITNDLRVNIK